MAKLKRAANRTARSRRKLVFFKAALRPPDGADQASVEISEAADVVDDRGAQVAACGSSSRVQQQTVDGEVPPVHILCGARGIQHHIRMPPVGIHAVGPEGCHLGDEPRLGQPSGPLLRCPTPPTPRQSARPRQRCAETSPAPRPAWPRWPRRSPPARGPAAGRARSPRRDMPHTPHRAGW